MTAPIIQDTFRPLTTDERRRVERFVRKVGELQGSSFAGQPIGLAGELVPEATHAGGQAWGITLNLPSDESLKAVIGDFRQLYTDTNPTSAMSVLKILSLSAHERGSQAGTDAVAALRKLRRQLDDRRKQDPATSMLEVDQTGASRERSPEDIIRLWINSEYLHDDLQLADDVQGRDDLGVGMLLMSFQVTIQGYIRVWSAIANIAKQVLDAFPTSHPD